jgi:serine/arginine repetitive matrix protein 2
MGDLLSSPDPLNDSPTFQSPQKTRRTSRARRSLPLASSPTKQTFELDVGDQISPQKIRVTVEAGNSDAENGYTHYIEETRAPGTSPSRSRANRRTERTTTTTVPVKGLSDSEDEVEDAQTPKRGRGRPRKSAGTPVPAKKSGRTSTPTGSNGRRRKSIGDLVDGDDEEDYNFQIGKGVQVGRGKGRSRSRSKKGTSRKSTPATKDTEGLVASSTTRKKGRGRRKSLLPQEVIVLEDENTEDIPEPEDADPDMDGALQPIDDNGSYPPSSYSTIRSTTTIGANDQDIIIARFDPGNETPRRTGWSSPRVIEQPQASNPAFNSYPSPSASPDKNENEDREGAATIPVSPEQHYDTNQDEHGNENYDDEGEDGLGEMPEFDTILESEGFSMISVDSVPSLREHLSSPINQEEKAAPAPRNRNLDSVKVSEAAAKDDSFSSIPDEILQAATPARKIQNPNFLSVQNSRIDDSFSSIPPEVLDAATPARKPIWTKLLPRRGTRVEDSFSNTAHEVLEAATTARDSSKPKSLQPNNSQVYEDSFSAIPSAVLDAVTPAPARQISPRPRPVADTITASDRLIVRALSRPNSSRRNSTNSTTTRLPTPEETPSPSTDSPLPAESFPEKRLSGDLVSAPVDQLSANEYSIHSQMRSSPPSIAPRRYTYTAHLRQRRELHPNMTQTPSIVFSSPSLPPPIHIARGQPVLPVQTEEIERPGLSPIARAGRALQDAVGPTLSPRVRAHSLGSPFKSPVADRKSSSSVAPSHLSPSQEQRMNPLPRSNVGGNLFPNPWNAIRHQDDPFSNHVPTRQHDKPQAQKQVYTLGLPEQRAMSDPRLSTIRSEGNSVLSEDAMSWQAEEEVTADDGTTSLANNINSSAGHRGSSAVSNGLSSGYDTTTSEHKWSAERDAVRKQIELASTSQVIVIDSDEEFPDNGRVEDDDEDFGLLLETLNSSSPAVQKPQVLLNDNGEKPRRSKLPSPWRKNSKRLVYSDELAQLSSPPHLANPMLGQPLANNIVSEADNALDLSSFFIPQKKNFEPLVRDSGNLDLSALLASSPNKSKLPVLNSQPNNSIPQESSYSSTSSFRIDESSKGPQTQPYAPIPQKLGFRPRVRNAVDADASSIFGSSPLKSNPNVNNIFGVY